MPGPYPLPTLAPTIDASGISAPTFEDVFASLVASYQQIYGTDVNLAADTQDGQWLAVQAQVIYDSNAALIAGYQSYSPSFAQGVGLSSIVKINGLQRLASSNSTVGITVAGDVGKIIVAGVVRDQQGYLWDLPPNTVIPLPGQVTVTAVCETPGEIMAAPGTVNIIQNVQPGWQSAINPASAAPGLPVESDATLRKRQAVSTALPAITPLESISAAVANVPGVGRLRVYENDTDNYDANLIPPHSISVVAEGGDATQIATTIALKKNTGCGTYGDIEVIGVDRMGVPVAINFFYLIDTPIWVAISIQARAGYLDTTGVMIVAAIGAFISTLPIGEDIYASWLYAPADLAGDAAINVSGMSQAQLDGLSATYVVRGIWIGTQPNPTLASDVPVAFNAAATANAATISLTLVP